MSVYFITCRETNSVKIGTSYSPHDRLAEIQTGSAHALKVEAILPGAFTEERELHARFADARLHGEWFAITAEIEALIEANPAGPPPTRVKMPGRPVRSPLIFGESVAQYEQRLRDEDLARTREAGMRWLEAKVTADPDLCFPFRKTEDA